ncbi:MAG: orotidine-5'-phosphate decarboxylase [Gemmatimonadota bacterium]|nr:orotidine-5'-phosphate decarboxylase [Gemmatimonadota bacterium]
MPGCWERIAAASAKNESRICVGLDTDRSRLPESVLGRKDPLYFFNCAVVDATIDLVCCYKPNMAFYEAEGLEGLKALDATIKYINGRVPVILDAKRGDIGNTARAYARACFEWLGADAVTVNPYLGLDSVAPFMEYPEKGVFVLCLTSNKSSADFQLSPAGAPLHEQVARKVLEWVKGRGLLGLVVGATHPDKIKRIRGLSGDLPFLLPGIGAQGGSLECVDAAETASDALGVVVNSSRSIIYAGSDTDFGDRAHQAAEDLRRLVGIRAKPNNIQEE